MLSDLVQPYKVDTLISDFCQMAVNPKMDLRFFSPLQHNVSPLTLAPLIPNRPLLV